MFDRARPPIPAGIGTAIYLQRTKARMDRIETKLYSRLGFDFDFDGFSRGSQPRVALYTRDEFFFFVVMAIAC